MGTVTISDVGTDEVTIPVSDTSDIIIQTLSDGPPLGSYIADHSLATNLDADSHPQYLNIVRGDARYASLSHEQDLTLHFTQASITLDPLTQLIGYSDTTPFLNALNTKLAGISIGAEVNNISVTNAGDLTDGGQSSLHYHDVDRARAVHTGTQILETVVNGDKINAPLTNLTLKEITNLSSSTGVTNGLTVVDAGAGGLNISSAEFLIRATSDNTGTLYAGYIANDSSLVVPDNTTQFLYIDYNAGVPIWAITADPTTINMSDRIATAIISRVGSVLNILVLGNDNVDPIAKIRKKSFYTESFLKANGGELSNPSALQIAVTAGDYWFGFNSFSHLALAGAGIFKYYYINAGNWLVNTTAVAINATQYNDITAGLVTLSNKNYCNHWIYATFGNSTAEYSVIHGQGQYASLAEALEELPPAILPTNVANLSMLIGAVTVYEDTAAIVSVREVTHFELSTSQGGSLIHPSTPPATAADTGTAGTITWDASYIYICIATDTWKRVAITTW